VACETVRLSSTAEAADDELAVHNPYSFGARSDATRLDRYVVGAFSPNSADAASVRPERDIRRHRDGEGVQLYRYLGRPQSRESAPPRPTRHRNLRPESAAQRSEAATASPVLLAAAVRKLRDWAAADGGAL